MARPQHGFLLPSFPLPQHHHHHQRQVRENIPKKISTGQKKGAAQPVYYALVSLGLCLISFCSFFALTTHERFLLDR
jgi:hypothetical protein